MRDETEEKWIDPLTKMTHWLTNAVPHFRKKIGLQDRIRVMSPQHDEYMENYELYGSEFGSGNPMYTWRAHMSGIYSVSYEGKSREEAVVLGSRMKESETDDFFSAVAEVKHKRKLLRKAKDFDRKEAAP